MTLNFQFNDTQLNQTGAFEEQDESNAQIGLWFSLGISMLSAFIIIFVLTFNDLIIILLINLL